MIFVLRFAPRLRKYKQPAPKKRGPPLQKQRVLIADDNEDLTNLIKHYIALCDDLEISGVARNGAETFELLQQEKPDVLILDLVMPDMDGIEVLRKIHTLPNQPIIVVTSALSNTVIKSEALALGARTYFKKPIELETLIKQIRFLTACNH